MHFAFTAECYYIAFTSFALNLCWLAICRIPVVIVGMHFVPESDIKGGVCNGVKGFATHCEDIEAQQRSVSFLCSKEYEMVHPRFLLPCLTQWLLIT